MALPLAVRKDIRDNEPKIQEATKKLSAALGFEVAVSINNEAIHAVLTEANNNKKDSFTVPIAQYFDAVARQIEVIAKDALVKEELARVISAKKFAFVLQKDEFPSSGKVLDDLGGRGYYGVQIKDGEFNIIIPVKYFWTNVDQLSNPSEISFIKVLSRTTTPPNTLPIHIRQLMAANDEKIKEAVKKVGAAAGFDVVFDFDVFALYSELKEYQDKIPQAVIGYISGLAENLAKTLKDDMVKEALLEVWKTKKLKVTFVKDTFADNKKYGGDSYIGLSLEGGDLSIVIPTKYFWCNMDNIKNLKIEKLL